MITKSDILAAFDAHYEVYGQLPSYENMRKWVGETIDYLIDSVPDGDSWWEPDAEEAIKQWKEQAKK